MKPILIFIDNPKEKIVPNPPHYFNKIHEVSIDRIITHVKDTFEIPIVASLARWTLKNTGFCIVLINQALVPNCIAEFSNNRMFYVWMLSYRLPIIDIIGEKMWSGADFHYWIPALIFSKQDPHVKLDLEFNKDIISPEKPHKSFFRFGPDLEVFIDIIKNVSPSEGIICDPLCGRASFFAAIAENKPFMGTVPNKETFDDIMGLIKDIRTPSIDNEKKKEESEEIAIAEKESTVAIQKYNIAKERFFTAGNDVYVAKDSEDSQKQEKAQQKLKEATKEYINSFQEVFHKRQYSLALIYDRGGYDSPRKGKCEICERDFFTYSHKEKHCSHLCRTDAIKKRKKERRLKKLEGRSCQVCHKKFSAKRMDMVFCSVACRQKGYRLRKAVTV